MKTSAAISGLMTTMGKPEKLCIQCAHYHGCRDIPVCRRPIGRSTSPVTGEEHIDYLENYCSSERAAVSWVSRLIGDTSCGATAIHYRAKNG